MAKPKKYKNINPKDLAYIYDLGFQDGFNYKQLFITDKLDKLLTGSMADIQKFMDQIGKQGNNAKFEDILVAIEIAKKMGINPPQ